MSQIECQELTIDPRADTTISSVAHEYKFPATWYRKANRARQTIIEAANYNKGYVFAGELDKLRDKLCGFAHELFTRLTDVANESGIKNPYDWAEAKTRA